jgi:membrane protease YdiL (CAAX protease family)
MLRPHTDLRSFLIVTFGASWLLALPLWLSGGSLNSPLALGTATLMMTTPSLGVVAVWRFGHRGTPFREWARQTGLTFGVSRSRTLKLIALAWLGIPALTLIAIALSAAIGAVDLDLDGLSLFRRQLSAVAGPAGAVPVDPKVLLAAQFAQAIVIAPLVNALPSLGEEWGWRGWLLPRLLGGSASPYGPGDPEGVAPEPTRLRRALLLSGLIWGVWHAPLTLRGYNYPSLGPWAALMFVGFCALFGVFLGWLRLRSGSVWPAVIGHGALNATAGLIVAIGDAANPPNLVVAGITGVVGWAVLAVVAVIVSRIPYGSRERSAEPV